MLQREVRSMKQNKVYACYNLNKNVRLDSSSGAVFSAMAHYVFEKHGVVYGVAMSEDCYSAEFIKVSDENGVKRLRGSKYLQAKVGNTFNKIKEDLKSGKTVLFTGTECQVNGLKNFLGKDYDNLICVDVICHGVPSPALWKKYVEYQEANNTSKLTSINFRCKDDSWNDFGMKEVMQNINQGMEKKIYISKDKDPFMQMFLRDYCLRPSCYNCLAKKEKRSDLTIGDFWGINDVAPKMNDRIGTSLVIIRTDKGHIIFNNINYAMKVKEVSYESGVKYNPAEYKSCNMPLQRVNFFEDMHKMDFETLKLKYASPIKYTLRTKVKRKLKSTVKNVFKLIEKDKD